MLPAISLARALTVELNLVGRLMLRTRASPICSLSHNHAPPADTNLKGCPTEPGDAEWRTRFTVSMRIDPARSGLCGTMRQTHSGCPARTRAKNC